MRRLIRKGLAKNIIKLIASPNDGCTVCQIGEHWFYFLDTEYENLPPSEIHAKFTTKKLAALIADAIHGLYIDEQQYYIYYLQEQCNERNTTS